MKRKTTSAAPGIVRQGDVLLVPVDDVPENARAEGRDGARRVLAEGEATGHAHVVTGRTRLLVEQRRFYNTTRPGRTFLVIEDTEPAVLEHDEHLPITLEPGSYEIRRQREYRPFGASRVAD